MTALDPAAQLARDALARLDRWQPVDPRQASLAEEYRAFVSGEASPRADAVRNTEVMLKALGIGPRDVGKLQAIPWPVIVREGYGRVMVVREPFNVHSYSPVVDGRALPRNPWADGAPPESAAVPLMAGTCRSAL